MKLQHHLWSYYDRWLAALHRVLVDSGMITGDEIDAVLAADDRPGG